jgi:predicted Rossmann-fold nucleotide-binding protein
VQSEIATSGIRWFPRIRTGNRAKAVPDTPQTRAPAYRLAYDDADFLCREELRPVRLQLELLKPELLLQERGIKSTVVLFGGARIPEPGGVAWAAKNETQRKNLEANARYYEEARAFARLCSEHSAFDRHREFVVVTGGGPGVMEAGNRGAADVGAPSIGLNIVLPHEQAPNEYVTPELCFNFHYFAIRKMHFLMRAKVIAVFPGRVRHDGRTVRIADADPDRPHGAGAGPAVRPRILVLGDRPRFPRRAGHDLAGRYRRPTRLGNT